MLRNMRRFSVGIDLGGTNLRAAAVSEEGGILASVYRSTPHGAPGDVMVAEIAAAVIELRNRLDDGALAGVGIGAPGIIVMEKGIITQSPNLPGLDGYPIRDRLESLLGLCVLLENDANAAALGEKWRGAGRDVDDLVLLTLGTGVGGGIIYRGEILHGFVGMAGELGHIKVVPDGYPCGCGGDGCLEKHASATAITAMARVMGLGDQLTAKEVFDLAQTGDKRAIAIFRSFGKALGTALSNLVNIFNFPLYLLSGGVLSAWTQFAPAMFQEVERSSYVYRGTCGRTRIEPATLGADAGIYGAAYLPWKASAAR